MPIWKWLGLDGPGPASDVDGLAHIERALAGLDPARARFIACFAHILTRSARADHQITDEEARQMERMVADRGGIPAEQATIVVEIARIQALRSGGTDDFLVTRQFNQIASREQKLALLDCLFAVSAADESILTVEDNEVRRVANELKLEHSDYIQTRTRHLKHLRVLRARPRTD